MKKNRTTLRRSSFFFNSFVPPPAPLPHHTTTTHTTYNNSIGRGGGGGGGVSSRGLSACLLWCVVGRRLEINVIEVSQNKKEKTTNTPSCAPVLIIFYLLLLLWVFLLSFANKATHPHTAQTTLHHHTPHTPHATSHTTHPHHITFHIIILLVVPSNFKGIRVYYTHMSIGGNGKNQKFSLMRYEKMVMDIDFNNMNI